MFIVFEGIDGSGKGTQIALLEKRLKEMGRTVYTTMEPSKSEIGTLLRRVLKREITADPRVAAQLFAADRLNHILSKDGGMKALCESGADVICDRYYFSSYAYQSLELPMEWIMMLNQEAEKLLRPDITIYLDLSADAAMERIIKNRAQTELFEQKQTLLKVRENYEKAFELRKETHRIERVQAEASVEEISERIWELMEDLYFG